LYCLWKGQKRVFTVTTCLENLGMLGNFIAVRDLCPELSKSRGIVSEIILSEKILLIADFTFGATPVLIARW